MVFADEKFFNRYWTAHRSSRMRLDPFRESQAKSIDRYVGSEYGDRGQDHSLKTTLVNSMLGMISAYSLNLAASAPRVIVETRFSSLKLFARKYQEAINNWLIEIQAGMTFNAIVMDALFGIGIGKVCMCASGNQMQLPMPEPGPYATEEEWQAYSTGQSVLIDPGKPFFERISLDDFNFDMSAKSWDKTQWQSHDYRVRMDEIKADPRIPKKIKDQLRPDSRWTTSDTTYRYDDSYSDDDDLEDMITISDVYFPHYQKWAMMSAKDQAMKPLYVDDWRGSRDHGPFLPMMFNRVPNRIMPIGLGPTLGPLHDAINALNSKATDSAINYKEILGFKNPHDAMQIASAKHMDTRHIHDPQSSEKYSFNGAPQNVVVQAQLLAQQFNHDAGNPDSMSGLGPQSRTFGQDQLIANSTSARLALMRMEVYRYATAVSEAGGHILWYDQTKSIPGQMMIDELSMPVDASWTPEDREGDYLQYNFKVLHGSMDFKTPMDRVTELDQTMMFLHGAVPVLAQLGMMPDYRRYLDRRAEYTDFPVLRELLQLQAGELTFEGVEPSGVAPGASPGGRPQQAPVAPQQQHAEAVGSLISSLPSGTGEGV